jgi:hypothetical protein
VQDDVVVEVLVLLEFGIVVAVQLEVLGSQGHAAADLEIAGENRRGGQREQAGNDRRAQGFRESLLHDTLLRQRRFRTHLATS